MFVVEVGCGSLLVLLCGVDVVLLMLIDVWWCCRLMCVVVVLLGLLFGGCLLTFFFSYVIFLLLFFFFPFLLVVVIPGVMSFGGILVRCDCLVACLSYVIVSFVCVVCCACSPYRR